MVKGWLAQVVRFLWKGRQAQELFARAEKEGTQESWRAFLTHLEMHVAKCGYAKEQGDFVIGVDASSTGWGAFLAQGDTLVRCISGTWPLKDRHRLANELELKALIKALRFFRLYTFGAEVKIVTDNYAVYSIDNASNQSEFVKRRLDEILRMQPTLSFVPGHSNIIPDFLSRY
ncbi:MAG: hypothetical protein Aurels2KO_58000 [Aureliella sp.]